MWLVLGVCIFSDLIDILINVIMFFATLAVVTIPLDILFWLVQLFIGTGVFAITFAYFYFSNAHLGVKIAGKLLAKRSLPIIMRSLSFILKRIPGLSVLPMTTIIFLWSVWIENRIRKGGKTGKAIEVAVRRLEPQKFRFKDI